METTPKYSQIMLSNRDFDFSAWFSEKAEAILCELSRIRENLDKLDNNLTREAADAYRESIDCYLAAALVDSVKMVSIINGCEEVYDRDDYLLIVSKGYDGI